LDVDLSAGVVGDGPLPVHFRAIKVPCRFESVGCPQVSLGGFVVCGAVVSVSLLIALTLDLKSSLGSFDVVLGDGFACC
jgi:hypothetical protein